MANNTRNTHHTPRLQLTADPGDLYALEEQVGREAFGVVHRARVKGTKDQVAIKIVDLEADVSELEAVKSEVETMALGDGLSTISKISRLPHGPKSAVDRHGSIWEVARSAT